MENGRQNGPVMSALRAPNREAERMKDERLMSGNACRTDGGTSGSGSACTHARTHGRHEVGRQLRRGSRGSRMRKAVKFCLGTRDRGELSCYPRTFHSRSRYSYYTLGRHRIEHYCWTTYCRNLIALLLGPRIGNASLPDYGLQAALPTCLLSTLLTSARIFKMLLWPD